MTRPGDPPTEQTARAARHDQLAAEARDLLNELDASLQWRRDQEED